MRPTVCAKIHELASFFINPQVLGKVGQVMAITSNGDVEVHLDDKSWTFNPLAVTCINIAETQEEVLTEKDDSGYPSKLSLDINLGG